METTGRMVTTFKDTEDIDRSSFYDAHYITVNVSPEKSLHNFINEKYEEREKIRKNNTII